jgi:hypothetical protein
VDKRFNAVGNYFSHDFICCVVEEDKPKYGKVRRVGLFGNKVQECELVAPPTFFFFIV